MTRRPAPGPRPFGAALGLLGALALTGCHAHRPASLADVRNDERVRVTLTPAGAAAVDSVVGTGHDRGSFSALYLGRSGNRLALGVPVGEVAPGTATRAVHTRVLLDPAEVIAVETREISAGRTALSAVVGAAVAAAGWALLR